MARRLDRGSISLPSRRTWVDEGHRAGQRLIAVGWDDAGRRGRWTSGSVLSKRIGHADVAFTMKQYVQTDLEADRQVAATLADLIIGGSLATSAVGSSPPAATAGIRTPGG